MTIHHTTSLVLAAGGLLLAGCSATDSTAQQADYRPPARDAITDQSQSAQTTRERPRSSRPGDLARRATATPAGDRDASTSGSNTTGTAAVSNAIPLAAPDGRLLPVQRTFVHSSGIPVAVLASGTGPQASPGGSVTVHTTGTFTADGSDFYTTVGPDNGNNGQPMTWDLDQLINGWKLVVPDMRVGDVWVIQVPWNLAYGEAGRKDDTTGEEVIPPRADLTFSIELFDVGPSIQ